MLDLPATFVHLVINIKQNSARLPWMKPQTASFHVTGGDGLHWLVPSQFQPHDSHLSIARDRNPFGEFG